LPRLATFTECKKVLQREGGNVLPRLQHHCTSSTSVLGEELPHPNMNTHPPSCSDNALGPEGAAALAVALPSLAALQDLELG
jgi:hypothetical protein